MEFRFEMACGWTKNTIFGAFLVRFIKSVFCGKEQRSGHFGALERGTGKEGNIYSTIPFSEFLQKVRDFGKCRVLAFADLTSILLYH